MQTVVSVVHGLINVLANFKQTNFDKKCSKNRYKHDCGGVSVRYRW